MTDRANIILGEGTGAVTVYCTEVKKIYKKVFVKITPPQSTANWTAGPKSTKIVDLLRLDVTLAVENAFIDSADETKLDALIKQGGVVKAVWNSADYYVNFDMVSINFGGKGGEQDEIPVSMTLPVGVNL